MVEGTGFENRHTGNRIKSSNLFSSAMKILAIETSCDETAISLVAASGSKSAPKFKVLAHQISSQVKLHAQYGGVVPSLAKREHSNNLVPILIQALTEAKLLKSSKASLINTRTEKTITQILVREPDLLTNINQSLTHIAVPKIDLITVTTGPGLEPALWVGINFAKALSVIWNKPVLGADHMAGHILSPLLIPKTKVIFPALALLISGGHTELILVKEPWKYKKIGQTRDDAVGEAFDKVARLMSLPYPGGPEISKLAEQASKQKINNIDWKFPRPMLHSGDFDFSFSGIKTSVLYAINKHGDLNQADKLAIAKEFQDAVIDVLTTKTLKALTKHKIRTLIIGGGVISNTALREAFKTKLQEQHPQVKLLIPEFTHATDNATMIAAAGYIGQFSKKPSKNPRLKAEGNASL